MTALKIEFDKHVVNFDKHLLKNEEDHKYLQKQLNDL